MNDSLPVPKMEFDPVDFNQATGMFNDDEKWKYLRCLIHYWYHEKTSGIPDDDKGMFELCHAEPHKWMRLKGMIFDNDKFFYLENGKWHQKRARANYLKKQEDLIKRQAQTSTARTERTAQSVTKANTKSDDFLDELSKSPAYSSIDIRHEFEKAKVWIGLPQNKGRILSHRFFVNWLNRLDRHMEIGIIPSAILSPNVTAIQNQKALERIEARLKSLREMRPMNGWPEYAPEIDEIKTLKQERTRLMQTLNLKA